MGSSEQGANATQGRWLVIPRTLCFVFYGDEVLLMKRGPHRRVFPNCYNGLGGHLERFEDPESGARREILEESGLIVDHLLLRGVYNIDTADETGIVLYVYTAWAQSKDIQVESDEGTLHWVPRDDAMTLDLVEDLPFILPRVFKSGEVSNPFSAHLSYDANDELVIRFADEKE